MREKGPFGLNFNEKILPEIEPDYLDELFKSLKDVRRFGDDEFDQIFWETDEQHILRFRRRATEIWGIEQLDYVKLLRIIYIHDIPETGQKKDVNGVKKQLDPQLAQRVDQNEEKVAERIFSSEDLALYKSFSQAGLFWKGKVNYDGNNPEATVAYILDKVDGNLAFHYRFNQAQKNQVPIKYPPDAVLKHLFLQVDIFNQRIEMIPDENIQQICHRILDDQVRYLGWLWYAIPVEDVPIQIREGLDSRLPEWRDVQIYA